MSCCPPGAWGELKPDADYKEKGSVEKLGDLPVYVTGKAGDDGKCVIWNYDIFGFNGGRTRQLCDVLGEQGYLVLLPDFYRGGMVTPTDPGLMDFIMKETVWAKLEADLNKVIEFAKGSKGAKLFGSVGTCWGTYPVMKLSARADFVAGVGLHPSHGKICPAFSEDEKALCEAAKDTKILFMPAGDDDVNVKPGGIAQQVLSCHSLLMTFHSLRTRNVFFR